VQVPPSHEYSFFARAKSLSETLAAVFAGSESTGLLYLRRFLDKDAGYPSRKFGLSTSIHLQEAGGQM
jgi:hypothetical protein